MTRQRDPSARGFLEATLILPPHFCSEKFYQLDVKGLESAPKRNLR